MDAAVAALLGAAIGAVASLGGAWIQQRHQTRRERLKLAADLGLADHARDYAMIKDRRAVMPPVSAYIAYHAEFLDALAKGPITAAQVHQMNERQDELLKAFPDPQKK